MTLYVFAMGVLYLVAILCTVSLYRMRLEAARLVESAQAYEREAALIYEKAREVYADAAARWSSVVRTEGRIH